MIGSLGLLLHIVGIMSLHWIECTESWLINDVCRAHAGRAEHHVLCWLGADNNLNLGTNKTLGNRWEHHLGGQIHVLKNTYFVKAF